MASLSRRDRGLRSSYRVSLRDHVACCILSRDLDITIVSMERVHGFVRTMFHQWFLHPTLCILVIVRFRRVVLIRIVLIVSTCMSLGELADSLSELYQLDQTVAKTIKHPPEITNTVTYSFRILKIASITSDLTTFTRTGVFFPFEPCNGHTYP
jgi:hypothetical protein